MGLVVKSTLIKTNNPLVNEPLDDTMNRIIIEYQKKNN